MSSCDWKARLLTQARLHDLLQQWSNNGVSQLTLCQKMERLSTMSAFLASLFGSVSFVEDC